MLIIPPITIALSVYNVAMYVRQALDSLLMQTFKDFELLCIDDCSTDGTWEILAEYAQHDNRIRLLRQEKNQGLSVSRNRAIAEAKGEYLLMLDGDDLFAPDMVEKAYNKAKETDADMVIWDYVSFVCEKEIAEKCTKPSVLSNLQVKDKVGLLRRPAFSPSRMTKVSVLRNLHVHFPEGLTKQDIPVHWKLITSLDKIVLIPEFFLFYRQQPGNTSSRKDRSVFALAYVMDITRSYLKENGLYGTYKNEFLRSRLNLLQGMYDFIKPEYKAEAMKLIMERLDDDAKTYIFSNNCECESRTRLFFKGYFWDKPLEKAKYDALMLIRSIYRWIKQ